MKRAENDSFSRCHPAVGIVFFLGAILFGAMIMHPLYILASGICALVYYCLLNGVKGIKTVAVLLPLVIVIAAVNPLFNHEGEHVLFQIFGRPYTWEALIYGASLAGMLVTMLLWMGCYNAVMTSDKFITLFGKAIPTISLLLLMVLRLVPNLLRKMRQLAGARKCIGRGAGEKSTKRQQAVDGMNVLSALISWALEGGVVTADSMKARGYGTGERSRFQIFRMTARDIVLLVLLGTLAAAVIVAIARDGTTAEFAPVVTAAPIRGLHAAGFAAYCAFLILPVALHVKEAIQWHISRSRI